MKTNQISKAFIEQLLCVRHTIYQLWQFVFETKISLMIWCVEKQLLHGSSNRMHPSCTRCQRLFEHEDNWLSVNISGCHISQILCQDTILGASTSHCKTLLIISYRNCICLFFIVVPKWWLLRVNSISNQQSDTGSCHWLFSLFFWICFTPHAKWGHHSPTELSVMSLVPTPAAHFRDFSFKSSDSTPLLFLWPPFESPPLFSHMYFLTVLFLLNRLKHSVHIWMSRHPKSTRCQPCFRVSTLFEIITCLPIDNIPWHKRYLTNHGRTQLLKCAF